MNKYFFTTCSLIALMAATPSFAHNQGPGDADPSSLKTAMNQFEPQFTQSRHESANIVLAQVHVRGENRRADRQADRQVDRREDRRADRQIDRQTDRRADRAMERRAERRADRAMERRADRRADRMVERRADRRADRAVRNHRGSRR